MRPHLKRMHQQVAVFKKHVSVCILSRVPEATFLLVALVLLTAWLSHPLIVSLQSLVAKGKKGKRKGKSSSQKCGQSTNLDTPGTLAKPQTESRPPMSKKRPTEVGATRGGPHHAPCLRPDQCMLCRQVGHRASECPNERKAAAFSPGKRAFGTYALGCAVLDAPWYGATVEESNRIKTRMTSKTLFRFQSRTWKVGQS